MIHITPITILIAASTAFVSGFIDTIAGGGGLITVPVLLLLGLPPQDALATNKLQACFGSGSAAYQFIKLGKLRWRDIATGVIYSAIGAGIGTIAVMLTNPGFLGRLIPVLMAIVLVYVLLAKRIRQESSAQPHCSARHFFLIAGLCLGFYDGFFGPGTGSFWTVALVAIMGMSLRHAVMHTKIYNFASNIVSLAVFLFGGHIHYLLGMIMAAGQWTGAWLATRVVFYKGAHWIRPIFIAMATVMLIITIRKYY